MTLLKVATTFVSVLGPDNGGDGDVDNSDQWNEGDPNIEAEGKSTPWRDGWEIVSPERKKVYHEGEKAHGRQTKRTRY